MRCLNFYSECNQTENLGGSIVKGLFKTAQGGEIVEDKKIIDLYWNRDENAITETAKKYGKYCFSIAFNILSNTEDAEESVNDSYLNAWNSIPPHRPAILSTFIGKVTRYVSLKKWRDKHAQKRGGGEIILAYDELSECIPSGNDIDKTIETQEIARIIDLFLDKLPTVEQRVFICRYWYFYNISAISTQFGFSESKIKSMLHRTRKKLRTKLLEDRVLIEE